MSIHGIILFVCVQHDTYLLADTIHIVQPAPRATTLDEEERRHVWIRSRVGLDIIENPDRCLTVACNHACCVVHRYHRRKKAGSRPYCVLPRPLTFSRTIPQKRTTIQIFRIHGVVWARTSLADDIQ